MNEAIQLRKEYQAGTMTKYVTFLESLIQKNGRDGFASTPSPIIADLTLWCTVKMIRTVSGLELAPPSLGLLGVLWRL